VVEGWVLVRVPVARLFGRAARGMRGGGGGGRPAGGGGGFLCGPVLVWVQGGGGGGADGCSGPVGVLFFR